MKHKRLNRDGWGFQYYPYYQMRIDCDYFHGMACLIRFTDGTYDEERANYPKNFCGKYRPSIWYVDIIEVSFLSEVG